MYDWEIKNEASTMRRLVHIWLTKIPVASKMKAKRSTYELNKPLTVPVLFCFEHAV